MTFKVITRGAPRPIRADFRCPVHGVFTALVDSGIDSFPCPALKSLYPYYSDPCSLDSPWSPSVIPMRVRLVEATRGGIERPEHADWDFTDALEQGQDPDEWQADRDAAAERRREQLVMDAVRSDG